MWKRPDCWKTKEKNATKLVVDAVQPARLRVGRAQDAYILTVDGFTIFVKDSQTQTHTHALTTRKNNGFV